MNDKTPVATKIKNHFLAHKSTYTHYAAYFAGAVLATTTIVIMDLMEKKHNTRIWDGLEAEAKALGENWIASMDRNGGVVFTDAIPQN